MNNDPYRGSRCLTEGYPDLEKLGVDHFKNQQPIHHSIRDLIPCLRKLIDLSAMRPTIAVIGCGPKPDSVRELLDEGFDACGIEPVVGFAQAAGEFLGDPARITVGGAEMTHLPTGSQSIVVLESVLEHVDSPMLSLAECYRILAPGGVLFLNTTNRFKISLRGENGEFRIPFYNWFPALVKEGYVFKHLHYAPHLANYSVRPAVHWFCYTELCRLGREVGFAQFYSRLDFKGSYATGGALKRFLKATLQNATAKSPWIRALALLQYGDAIFMYKRPE